MSTPTEELNLQIDRLSPFINSKPGSEDFINALKSLKEFAEKDHEQNWFLSLSRTKINWAPSLVKEVVDVLQDIKNSEHLDKELPKLIKICEEYKKEKDITYPWAKILGHSSFIYYWSNNRSSNWCCHFCDCCVRNYASLGYFKFWY